MTERLLELQRIMALRHQTLGFAESCTGGLISSQVVAAAGVSSFYKGAVVCYSRQVKQNVLHVPSSLLAVHGEVSLPVAKAMAVGAQRVLNCDWALSVTGVAGPSGGSVEKPVGFVCFALVGPGFEEVCSQQFAAAGGRQDIQRHAALFAFDFLLNALR